MNLTTIFSRPQRLAINFKACKMFFICIIIFISINLSASAQTYREPSWWLGVAGAANFNAYNGAINKLNPDITIATPFKYGYGVGGFVAPLLEFHRPKAMFGFMLQEGLDNRRANFERPNNSQTLFVRISYFTVEPSIRFAPFRSNFYLYAGPRLGFLWSTTLKYERVGFTDYPNPNDPNAEAYLSHLKKNLVGMQVGVGYDIHLTAKTSRTQFILSPFVSYHPGLRQNIRTIESLRLNTIRAGIALKIGVGRKVTQVIPPMDTVVKEKDRDGDGVFDKNDKCPDVPGLASLQGCPDRDGDGITDAEDKCPDVAGVARYQGCPIPDRDKDGINDEVDKCPDVPGVARYQGCPIPDTDGDGVNDEEDKCINEKGPASNFGCPVIAPEIIKRVNLAAKNIFFATASDKLLSQSNKRLDDVVAILNENASFKVDIGGHTDDQGKDEYNQQLSEKRAASVKAYLVSKGVSESRLTSTGYGKTQPVADNKTAKGRAQNRRVEMTLKNY